MCVSKKLNGKQSKPALKYGMPVVTLTSWATMLALPWFIFNIYWMLTMCLEWYQTLGISHVVPALWSLESSGGAMQRLKRHLDFLAKSSHH